MPYGKIQAGKLRHRIDIVTPSTTQDELGQPLTTNETVFASVPASIEMLSGRELYAAQQMVSQATHKITIRWLAAIKPKYLVTFEGRTFQVEAVTNPDERHKMLVLLCIERNEGAR